MPREPATSIELRDVVKVYDLGQVKVRALDGVSLTVSRGELVSIVGPSGSGKSTLFNIMGLLDSPTSGTISIDGRDVSTMHDDERTAFRARQVGMVFQFYNLVPVLSALENVMLPLAASGTPRHEQVDKARHALSLVGLEERQGHRPHELSGGEQQRVCIARAMIASPAMILADEPTGNLDQEKGRGILDLFRRMNQETNQGFLIITHDPAIAALTDRTIVMEDGRIVSDGARLGGDDGRHEAVPVTARAMDALRRAGAGRIALADLARELGIGAGEAEHVVERLALAGRIRAHLDGDAVVIDTGVTGS